VSRKKSRNERLSLAIAAVGLLVSASTPALAEGPDAWDLARAPNLEHRIQTMAAVEQALATASLIQQSSDMSRSAARALVRDQGRVAWALLQELEPGECASADVCFAEVNAAAIGDDDASLIRVAGRAERLFPSDPRLADCQFELAVAYARTGRRDLEIAAYTRHLANVSSDDRRFTALSNRAESRFALGDPEGAMIDYREAIRIRPGRQGVLARLGLAFTLDHLGDFSGTVQEMRASARVDAVPSQLEQPGVFFVPPYEIDWYRALVSVGRAENAESPGEKAADWELAGQFYELYTHHAIKGDKAIPLASARAAMCRKVAQRFRAEEAKRPRPRVEKPDDFPLPGFFPIR
jgi:tetratricopeptide (TPR) repeat protein